MIGESGRLGFDRGRSMLSGVGHDQFRRKYGTASRQPGTGGDVRIRRAYAARVVAGVAAGLVLSATPLVASGTHNPAFASTWLTPQRPVSVPLLDTADPSIGGGPSESSSSSPQASEPSSTSSPSSSDAPSQTLASASPSLRPCPVASLSQWDSAPQYSSESSCDPDAWAKAQLDASYRLRAAVLSGMALLLMIGSAAMVMAWK